MTPKGLIIDLKVLDGMKPYGIFIQKKRRRLTDEDLAKGITEGAPYMQIQGTELVSTEHIEGSRIFHSPPTFASLKDFEELLTDLTKLLRE